MQGSSDPNSDRLTRVEEGLAFAQHDLDGLSAQVRDLFDAMAALRKRLDSLEGRVDSMNEPGSDETGPT